MDSNLSHGFLEVSLKRTQLVTYRVHEQRPSDTPFILLMGTEGKRCIFLILLPCHAFQSESRHRRCVFHPYVLPKIYPLPHLIPYILRYSSVNRISNHLLAQPPKNGRYVLSRLNDKIYGFSYGRSCGSRIACQGHPKMNGLLCIVPDLRPARSEFLALEKLLRHFHYNMAHLFFFINPQHSRLQRYGI